MSNGYDSLPRFVKAIIEIGIITGLLLVLFLIVGFEFWFQGGGPIFTFFSVLIATAIWVEYRGKDVIEKYKRLPKLVKYLIEFSFGFIMGIVLIVGGGFLRWISIQETILYSALLGFIVFIALRSSGTVVARTRVIEIESRPAEEPETEEFQ